MTAKTFKYGYKWPDSNKPPGLLAAYVVEPRRWKIPIETYEHVSVGNSTLRTYGHVETPTAIYRHLYQNVYVIDKDILGHLRYMCP